MAVRVAYNIDLILLMALIPPVVHANGLAALGTPFFALPRGVSPPARSHSFFAAHTGVLLASNIQLQSSRRFFPVPFPFSDVDNRKLRPQSRKLPIRRSLLQESSMLAGSVHSRHDASACVYHIALHPSGTSSYCWHGHSCDACRQVQQH